MSVRKILYAAILAVLVSICFSSAAFALPEDVQISSPIASVVTERQVVQIIESVNGSGLYPVLAAESVALSADESQMLALLNRERSVAGLSPLQSDSSLVKAARLKAQDMVDKHYFSHNSPTYGSPFDMLKTFGISYTFAGENLAMAASAASAHNALMASPGHRANMLNSNYDRVGIGIAMSGRYRYCVQLFTGGQRATGTTGTNTAGGSPGAGSDCTGGQTSCPSQTDYPGQTSSPPQTACPSPADPQTPPSASTSNSADEELMVLLINQDRARAGLPALKADGQLSAVARLKAQDFVNKRYFGHTSPTYGSVRNMLTTYGIKYTNAGENLAASYSVTRAQNALMNSSGNRANILSRAWTRVGIGIVANGSYYFYVQIFADDGVSSPDGGNTSSPPSGSTTTPPDSGSAGEQPDTGTTGQNTAGLTADDQKMLNLVNAAREANGVAPLQVNLKLTGVARLKVQDMIKNNYFSHTSPTYGSPFDMMKEYGITYRTAGENLAGAPNVDMAHTNLMNSSGHRANILNSSFREVGIGIVDGGPYGKMFVQMFIG